MLKYILGLLSNLFNRGVSIFALIDHFSKVSKKARVYRKAKVFNSTIGNYSYVGKRSSVVCADVGNFCSIADGVSVGLGIHTLDKLSTSPIFTEECNATTYSWYHGKSIYPYKRVKVGNDVWIGTKVIVMGGVTVGDGAVIGAGSIVTKDVPPYAIVAGVPAKIIRYRFSEEIVEELQNVKWWNLSEDILKENISLFQKDEILVSDLEQLKRCVRG